MLRLRRLSALSLSLSLDISLGRKRLTGQKYAGGRSVSYRPLSLGSYGHSDGAVRSQGVDPLTLGIGFPVLVCVGSGTVSAVSTACRQRGVIHILSSVCLVAGVHVRSTGHV